MEKIQKIVQIPNWMSPVDILGEKDSIFKEIKKRSDVKIQYNGQTNSISIFGDSNVVSTVVDVFYSIIARFSMGESVSRNDISDIFNEVMNEDENGDNVILSYHGKKILTRTSGQKRYLDSIKKNDITICTGYAGSSKACDVDEDILYLDGDGKSKFKKFGLISIGDIVFDECGIPTKVTGVFPQGKKRVYKVTLEDGRSVKCSDEHLWSIFIDNDKKRYVTDTKSVKKMLDKKIPIYIPMNMGIINNSVKSSSFDSDDIFSMSNWNRYEMIKNLYVTYNGHIDDENGCISYFIDDKDLLLRMRQILFSCGIYNMVMDNGMLHVYCSSDLVYYLVPEHDISDIDTLANFSRVNNVKILSIDETDEYVYMVCIKVDAPKHTFLIGKNFMVTHNTFTAVSYGIHMLCNNEIDKIIITRPLIDAGGEEVGIEPGTITDKLYNWMLPCLDVFEQVLGKSMLQKYIENGKIQMLPLGRMRGLSFHNVFCIADEMQNASVILAKLIVTRIGEGSKIVVCGDPQQTDLRDISGLSYLSRTLSEIPGIGVITLGKEDVVRHGLISKMLDAFEKEDSKIDK